MLECNGDLRYQYHDGRRGTTNYVLSINGRIRGQQSLWKGYAAWQGAPANHIVSIAALQLKLAAAARCDHEKW